MTHFTEEETEAQKRGESRDWDSVVRGVHPAEPLEGDFGSILLGDLETPYAIDQGCLGDVNSRHFWPSVGHAGNGCSSSPGEALASTGNHTGACC